MESQEKKHGINTVHAVRKLCKEKEEKLCKEDRRTGNGGR
jgi:hypothetical protein